MQSIVNNKYLRILTVVLVAQAALFYTASRGDSRPLRQPLKQFPATMASWRMVDEGVVEQETLDVLKADDVMTRTYAKDLTPFGVNLFVAYFKTQQTGQAPHSPKNCLPGSGWQQSATGELDVSLPGRPQPIRINRYIVSKGEIQSVVLYWYQSHGRVVANEFAAKFYLVADSVRYHRSDTALVRIVVQVVNGDIDSAVNLGTDFVRTVYPQLVNYLPL